MFRTNCELESTSLEVKTVPYKTEEDLSVGLAAYFDLLFTYRLPDDVDTSDEEDHGTQNSVEPSYGLYRNGFRGERRSLWMPSIEHVTQLNTLYEMWVLRFGGVLSCSFAQLDFIQRWQGLVQEAHKVGLQYKRTLEDRKKDEREQEREKEVQNTIDDLSDENGGFLMFPKKLRNTILGKRAKPPPPVTQIYPTAAAPTNESKRKRLPNRRLLD